MRYNRLVPGSTLIVGVNDWFRSQLEASLTALTEAELAVIEPTALLERARDVAGSADGQVGSEGSAASSGSGAGINSALILPCFSRVTTDHRQDHGHMESPQVGELTAFTSQFDALMDRSIFPDLGQLVILTGLPAFGGSVFEPGEAAVWNGHIAYARGNVAAAGASGIRINVAGVGILDLGGDQYGSPSLSIGSSRPLSPEMIHALTRSAPLRRLPSLSDLAFVLSFLLSDRSSYVTGAVIPVDCGLTIGVD